MAAARNWASAVHEQFSPAAVQRYDALFSRMTQRFWHGVYSRCTAQGATCAPVPLDDSYRCAEPEGMDDAWVQRFLTFSSAPDSPPAYEIGRGGSGIVMANDAHPQWVIKTSKQAGPVATATRIAEFKTICAIRTGLAAKTLGMQAHAVFRIAHVPYLVEEEQTTSMFVMERVMRPVNAPTTSRLAMQAYMGKEENSGEREGRGDYVGLPVVLQALGLTDEQRPLLMGELGRFVGAIHYGLGYDLSDVEYLVGHTHDDPTDRIYAVDFDRCSPVADWSARRKVVDQLSAPIWAEPYFPGKDSPALFEAFSQGYLSSAANYGHKDVAEDVLEDIP